MAFRNERDIVDKQTDAVFTVTNWTSDSALDCDGNSDLATADVLGTLIKVLQEKKIIEGTTSA